MERSKYSRFGSPENMRTSASTRRLKAKAEEFVSDTVTSKSRSTTNHTDGSPNIIRRCPSRNPVPEMKRSSRATELERRIARLEEDTRRTKDRLGLSESLTRRARKEAEDAKEQHAVLSAKYKESRREFAELAALEEARNQELYVISKEMDRAWQAELEAALDHHSVNLAALNSATDEIQRLKKQLAAAAESKSARAKRYERICFELGSSQREMMETVATIENVKIQILDRSTQSRQLDVLEQSKLKESADLLKSRSRENSLEASLANRLEEQVKNTVLLHSAYESVDRSRREHALREAVLNSELANTNSNIVDLNVKLFDVKRRMERANDELVKRYRMAKAEAESSSTNERELTARIALVRAEAERSNVIIARATEQLDAVRAVGSETEAEIRRQRARLGQWRKAAEAAVAILAAEEEEDESRNNVLKKIVGFLKDLTIT